MPLENYDTETLRAIIAEAKRQGFSDEIIALNLGITRDDPAFGYTGEGQLRVGLWSTCFVMPGCDHHESNILRLIERGRASIDKATRNDLTRSGRHALPRNMSPTETLATMVDYLGCEGARNLIAHFARLTGDYEIVAAALHIPKAAAFAVITGSFPANDSAETIH